MRAIAENRKADNPKPETMNPIAVVIYTQEQREGSRCYRARVRTDDFVGEAFGDCINHGGITSVAANPGEQFKKDECEQCSVSDRFCTTLRGVIYGFDTEVSGRKKKKGESERRSWSRGVDEFAEERARSIHANCEDLDESIK